MAESSNAGAGAGLIGGALGTGLSFLGASQAWKRQKKVLKNQIQWKVQDLRNAGLNPILAASSGLGGGGGSAPGAPPIPDFAGALTTGRKVSSENKLRNLQGKQAMAQIMHTRSMTGVANAQQQKTMAEMFESIMRTKILKPKAQVFGVGGDILEQLINSAKTFVETGNLPKQGPMSQAFPITPKRKN